MNRADLRARRRPGMADRDIPMTLEQLLKQRIGSRAAGICPTRSGDLLVIVENGAEMDEEVQRQLWREGPLFVVAGEIRMHSAWHMSKAPDTSEAKRISTAYGRNITACFSRDPPE